MRIERIENDKWRFRDILLLADEQESMIARYLDRGDLFALYDDDLRSICVVTREGEGVCEVKNLATYEQYQRRGYGRALLNHVAGVYRDTCRTMLVGTGDAPSSLRFYESCGFTVSHRIPNFFTDNYDHIMVEDGVQLVDMVYLKREL